MAGRHQFDCADYGGGADAGGRRDCVSKISGIEISSNNVGVR